jgi:hypothetical protein
MQANDRVWGASMSSYLPGDYVKVEFSDEASGVGERVCREGEVGLAARRRFQSD